MPTMFSRRRSGSSPSRSHCRVIEVRPHDDVGVAVLVEVPRAADRAPERIVGRVAVEGHEDRAGGAAEEARAPGVGAGVVVAGGAHDEIGDAVVVDVAAAIARIPKVVLRVVAEERRKDGKPGRAGDQGRRAAIALPGASAKRAPTMMSSLPSPSTSPTRPHDQPNKSPRRRRRTSGGRAPSSPIPTLRRRRCRALRCRPHRPRPRCRGTRRRPRRRRRSSPNPCDPWGGSP